MFMFGKVCRFALGMILTLASMSVYGLSLIASSADRHKSVVPTERPRQFLVNLSLTFIMACLVLTWINVTWSYSET